MVCYNGVMKGWRERLAGFTIVELVVVIVVIGALAAITLVGFTRYQQTTRDTQRVSKISVVAEALEKYYDSHGEYPGCTSITGAPATVTGNSGVLSGVDISALTSPNPPDSTGNSIQCTDLTSMTQPDFYAYIGDGSSTCTSGSSCLQFTLKYKDEQSGTIKTINSRHTATIATSGTATLSSTNLSFSQVTLNWTVVPNAASYELSTNGTVSPVSGLTYTPTELSQGTSYAFKIRAKTAAGVTGEWSNTLNVTTLTLAAPTISSLVADSPTAYTTTWGAVTNANSYNIQCSTNGTTWGPSCQANTTATSYQFTNGTVGGHYWTRVQTVNTSLAGGPTTSTWSASANVYTVVNPPAAYTISSTQPAWNSLVGTSNAVCGAGTTPDYQWYQDGVLWSGQTSVSATATITGPGDSVSIYVRTRCTAGGQYSSYVQSSNTASKSLASPYAWAGNCAIRTACWDGSCPSGTTSSYIHWWVNSAAHGQPWVASNAGVGYGTWYNSGTWGDGDVRSTTYCTGPWGTATSGGWGPFGSGCVPTIKSGWCTV